MSESDYAIRIEGIGKRYRIGREQAGGGGMYRYKSLRDSLGGVARRPLSTLASLRGGPMTEDNSFWALKDVSFDVKKGEVVGIIGRNGAGKSTLLKILSRITKPTVGHVELRGRVGSLLEVGTGFHPELTGRENVYLNGAILGMTRAEVRAKFDEIVAFSEIEKFLDTPVKHYSSGMYTRLAFAVAAHLEPEILVVDEVLAVGDAQFQTKCLGKMSDIASEGRTVLFVSHNMQAVGQLTLSAVLLEDGEVTKAGSTDSVLQVYLGRGRYLREKSADMQPFRRNGRSPHIARFETVEAVSTAGAKGHGTKLRTTIRSTINTSSAVLLLNVHDRSFRPVLSWCSADHDIQIPIGVGSNTLDIDLGTILVDDDEYLLDIWINPSSSQLAWDALEQVPIMFKSGASSITPWPQRAVNSSPLGSSLTTSLTPASDE